MDQVSDELSGDTGAVCCDLGVDVDLGNEAKHPKRPRHQSHIHSAITEARHKALVQLREPEEPLPILRCHQIRKRVKSRPLLRRKS